MARVTDDLLRTVIELEDDLDTSTFIDTANVIVNTFIVPTYTVEAILVKIELYLAAHFASLMSERGGLIRSMQGDASETYADIYDKGYRATRFGQQAIVLDPSGTLASMSTDKVKAQLELVSVLED